MDYCTIVVDRFSVILRYHVAELFTMKHHIFVTVQGGVAEVCEDTQPPGVVVEILDFDNMAGD